MKILEPYAQIESAPKYREALAAVEFAARTCYKSELSSNAADAERFIRSVIKRGHESVLEHYSVTVRFICDRGVSHELVRHRLASISQESSRFCNYSSGKFGNEIAVIKPHDIEAGTVPYVVWKLACKEAERVYLHLLACGIKPETARSVLPTSLKTEVVMTANLREWRHFLKLRSVGVTGKPHPDMKLLADDLLRQFKERLPVFFEDIAPTTVKREEPKAEPKPQEEPKSDFSLFLKFPYSSVFFSLDAKARNI